VSGEPPRGATADPLGGIAILAEIDADARTALARRCRWRSVPAGTRLVSRDETGGEVLFLVAGEARVMDQSLDGRELTYARVGAGAVLGELAALDGGPRSASITALTDCRIAALPGDAFRALVLRHPTIALGLLEQLARALRSADLKLMELVTMGAVQRIARHLLRLPAQAAEAGGLVIAPLPTQEMIAAATGTTRETVGRVMVQLRHAGVVERRGRRLVVAAPERLRGLAGLDARPGDP
jgi:CRP-like cAMP-binding protein